MLKVCNIAHIDRSETFGYYSTGWGKHRLRNMDTGTKVKMLHLATESLDAVGLSYELVTEQAAATPRLEALEKQEPIYPLDVYANDFLKTKIIWVFFQDKSGLDVGVIAARLEELGDEDVVEYWRRSAKRQFPAEDYGTEPFGLSGDVVHIGDAFFAREWREPTGHIRAALFTVYLLCSLHWTNAASFYAFIRETNMMRGGACEYGATRQYLVPNIWVDTVADPLWLVAMTLSELERQSRVFLSVPNVFGSYKQSIKPRAQNSKRPSVPPMYPVEAPSRTVQ